MTQQEKEEIIIKQLLTPQGKAALSKAMHLDTCENFEEFYGPIFDGIFKRAQEKYIQKQYDQFVKNFISLCQ